MSLHPIIAVRFDRVYGKLACYPVNEQAGIIAKIARTKTLSASNLIDCRRLGFEILEAGGTVSLEAFLTNHRIGA